MYLVELIIHPELTSSLSLKGQLVDDGYLYGCPPLTENEYKIFLDYIEDYYGGDPNEHYHG
jgi:hypothetical protein